MNIQHKLYFNQNQPTNDLINEKLKDIVLSNWNFFLTIVTLKSRPAYYGKLQ